MLSNAWKIDAFLSSGKKLSKRSLSVSGNSIAAVYRNRKGEAMLTNRGICYDVSMQLFKKSHKSAYEELAKRWAERHRKIQENLWYKHGGVIHNLAEHSRQFAVGSIAGLALLLASPSPLHPTTSATAQSKTFADLDKQSSLMLDLMQYVPPEVRPLTPNEETKITQLLSQRMGFSVAAELEGKRLNRSYGYIGQEQHLYRYPGDNIATHFDTPEDAQKYAEYGIAPGLGAYGYFARSQSQLTEEANLREKYYIAVQTFLAPGYNENVAAMNKFFMFRKMLVVNPDNGKALVADIGDSGPAEFTGKSLGGSPEVMKYLERVDGVQKGPVLYFFIDDPNNQIPLGPLQYQ